MKMNKYLTGVILVNLSVFCFGQQSSVDSINSYERNNHPSFSLSENYDLAENLTLTSPEVDCFSTNDEPSYSGNNLGRGWGKSGSDYTFHTARIDSGIFRTVNSAGFMKQRNLLEFNYPSNTSMILSFQNDNFFEKNRRNIYSSMWTFASLNYLYCDLVAFMDKDLHSQYHTGTVDGTNMTPQFLTGAAVMMQIAITNVFLPQVIKKDKALKWVQIASGITMTLIQSASLFVGKPTPYYATFSAFEIGATTFITINALKWKTNSKKPIPQ